MNRTALVILAVLLTVSCEAGAAGSRRVLNLDGAWELALARNGQKPTQFDRRVPVPGLVDLAQPAFAPETFQNKKRRYGAEDIPLAQRSFWCRREFVLDGELPAVATLAARLMAAETEFWRGRRQAAGVLHFCGLGYSRPDGQTSDHWLDIKQLLWEPEFYRYVRDAFSPVGLMVDFAREKTILGSRAESIPVRVINDLAFQKKATASSVHAAAYAPGTAVDGDPATYWSSSFADPAWLAVDLGEARKIGQVRVVWETAFSKAFSVETSLDGQAWSEVYRTSDGHGGTSAIRFPSTQARHVRILCVQRGTQWGHAIRELQVFE